MELASDVGPTPMQVGAILRFAPGSHLTEEQVRAALADRLLGVPRLRRRLERTPAGCGRAIWVDDPTFDTTRHIHRIEAPDPGGEEALLSVAAGLMVEPLPSDRPLWAAWLVSGTDTDPPALVVLFHHVLADGIGGLAVLAQLVDGAPPTSPVPFPRPSPTRRRLARDAAVDRVRTLLRIGAAPGKLKAGLAELAPGTTPRAPVSSLNRPVGRRRRVAIVRADLTEVRSAAHRAGATVNDVMLAAVGGALGTLLAHRGEHADRFVVSVPVSARAQATASGVGNQVGLMPVVVPASGPRSTRLRAVAESTRRQKTAARGASAALMAPLFRVLGALGVLRLLMEHQHRINAWTTNLRGPDTPVAFLGQSVAEVVPVTVVAGNVGIAFAMFSYANTLTISVTVDSDAVPDLDILVEAFRAELDTS